MNDPKYDRAHPSFDLAYERFEDSGALSFRCFYKGYCEGRVDQARLDLLQRAEGRFGAARPEILTLIREIDRLSLLVALTDRLLGPTGWDHFINEHTIREIWMILEAKSGKRRPPAES